MNAAEFAYKFQSKREIWRFLSSKVGAYLASYETMTIYHLKEIAAGSRKMILCTEIKHLNVPFFEGLKVDAMIEFAKKYPEVMRALPSVENEIKKLPR